MFVLASARVSWTSQNEGNLSWKPPRLPAMDVKPSDMRHSMPSESTHAFRNRESDDYRAHNQERRSSFETQQHYGSFAARRHPRVPLPTQNQQSRLHNRVSVFEGVTQPYIPGLSPNNHADAPSWLRKEANGTPSNTKQALSLYKGSKHNVEESGNTYKKGTMFLSKLEEVCSTLKKKDEFTRQSFSMNEEPLREEEALRDDNASTQVGQGFQNATGQGRSAQGNGVSISLKRKDVQSARHTDSHVENFVGNAYRTNTSDYMLKKNATGDDVGITSFNLFSSSPSVPWDADRRYSTTFKPCIPIRRGYRSRRLSTSVGSRSIPSQLSVKSRNLSYLKHPSHAATGVMGLLKSGERGEQMEPWLDGIKTQDVLEFKDVKFTASQKRAPQFINQVESLDFDWSDSDTEEKEDNMFMHSGAEEKADNVVSIPLAAEEVTPTIESSSSARSPHVNLICRDSDSKVDGDNVLPDLLNAKYDASPLVNQVDGEHVLPDLSNAKYDASPLGKPNCSDAVSKIDGDNAEDATPTQSNSIERSLSNKKDVFSSASLTCTQDTTSATPPVAVSSGAPDTCNDSNPTNSASWQKHNLPNLPFEFQYSYSETPKAPVLGYREAPFSPFGPRTVGRPWTGRPPLNPSKKKVREFDSFNPPPRDKKGIKFVQDPGPYPEGQSPKPAKSREEVMGEPLTKEEIVYLVEKCQRESRQLNLGRDGLTHNMLDMIHSHWKRRRVCRIKCKGVPTVDMENVMFHIEDKTGGKIIYHTGGVLYLFRGRNYNYKDRPQIPLMLWKPAAPVYPKLIQPDPGGLTIKEAQKLCRLGRKTEPICRLGKNGVYLTLVEDVRTAFKVDDLVRIDCQGLNPSDYKKIGAKLRDLVPCVLLSFDKEQILIWRGKKEPSVEGTNLTETPNREAAPTSVCSDVVECPDPIITQNGTKVSVDVSADVPSLADREIMKQFPMADDRNANKKNSEKEGNVSTRELVPSKLSDYGTAGTELEQNTGSCAGGDSPPEEVSKSMDSKLIKTSYEELVPVATVSSKSSAEHEVEGNREAFDGLTSTMVQACEHLDNQSDLVVRVDALWDHAFQSGMAIELTEADTDSDLIVRKAARLAQSAPLGPKYTLNLIHKLQLKTEEDRPDDVLRIQFGRGKPPKRQQKVVKRQFQLPTVDVPGMGGLPVDNLAMLLAPKQLT